MPAWRSHKVILELWWRDSSNEDTHRSHTQLLVKGILRGHLQHFIDQTSNLLLKSIRVLIVFYKCQYLIWHADYLRVHFLPHSRWFSVVSRVTCGACGPNHFTPRPAAPASWRYDAPWGELTSTGEDCGSFTLPRGKERGRAHSEAMSSSLVHAFPPNLLRKTLQRTLVCVDHSASARLIFGPYIRSSMLPLSVCFLFITAHPACAVSVHTSSPPFFPCSTLL